MSRIGRLPVALPDKVTAVYNNNVITINGEKGSLSQEIRNPHINVIIEDKELKVVRNNEEKETKAAHGLYRALIHNMVEGVTKGFSVGLIIAGVGYKAQIVDKALVLNIGYSHSITVKAPEGITLACPTLTEITVSGIDKNAVGQCAANIKALRKPEPFHGYGIRYKTETIMRKEPKKSAK